MYVCHTRSLDTRTPPQGHWLRSSVGALPLESSHLLSESFWLQCFAASFRASCCLPPPSPMRISSQPWRDKEFTKTHRARCKMANSRRRIATPAHHSLPLCPMLALHTVCLFVFSGHQNVICACACLQCKIANSSSSSRRCVVSFSFSFLPCFCLLNCPLT